MKTLNIVTSSALFLIFFVWAFNGNYDNFLTPYLPYLPVYFLVTYVILSLKNVKNISGILLKTISSKAFIIFPITALIYAISFNALVLEGKPHVQDEINMFFQAQAILNGAMTRPLHPHYEFFRFLYIIPAKGGTYSLYQPGYSILLAPFLLLGIPQVLNPLLSSGAVYLLGKISEKLFNRKTAVLSMALATASAFLMPMGGTFMNHTVCAFSALASMWFLLKSFEKKPILNTVAASLFIVAIMFTRPQIAPFILISGLITVFVNKNFKTFALRTVTSGLTILPFFILILYSESLFTGSMLTPRHIAYFSYSEPVSNALGLGLYKGCRFNTIIPLPIEGLTFSHAIDITYLRLVQMVYGMFFHPIFFIFLPILFLILKKRDQLINEYLLLQYFLVIFSAFFFYYYDGNVYGPRYYYEASFFLVPLFARGVILSTEKLTKHGRYLQPETAVYAFILSGFIFYYSTIVPHLFDLHKNAFWGMDPNLGKLVEKEGITNSLIFISPDLYYSSGAGVMNLADIDSNDNIYAADLGDSSNNRLADYYGDRDAYKAFFDKNKFSLKKASKLERNRKVIVEMEHKSYPVDGIPDYCNKYPFSNHIDLYSGFFLPPEVFNSTYFFCRFKTSDQFYEFGQSFKKSGHYKVDIKAVSGPLSGEFVLTVNDQKKTVNLYSQDYLNRNITVELDFSEGFNYIRLQPLDIRAEGSYFIIDKLEFTLLEK